MTKVEIISIIADQADQVIGTLADHDDCIMGIAEVGGHFRVCYDGNQIKRKLVAEGMEPQDAEDEIELIQALLVKKCDPIIVNNLENGLRW